MESQVGHVSLVSHEAFAAVVATEREVPGVSPLVPNQFVSISKLLLAKLAGEP
jgi:hypothetical protein